MLFPNPHPKPTGTTVNINLKPVKIKLLPALLFTALLALFILYFTMPVLNLRFVGWVFALAFVLLPLLAVKKLARILKYVYLLLGLFLVLAILFSAGIFRAKSYRNLLGEVKSTNFTELISPVSLDQIPTVDRDYAAALAEKKLGDDFALGSRVTLGIPTRQMVKGKLIWVVPLLHSGFFKWLANQQDGTPAYITVSATNAQDIQFVREVNGKPVRIVYQPNSYFNQNLYRRLYLHGFATKGLGGPTFEIDDTGEPYWTITPYVHKVGMNGNEGTGIITIHAGTGAMAYYPLEKTAAGWSDAKIPAWVDRIQPAAFVLQQLDWWGKYVKGFWNTVFGKRNMLTVTNGYSIIYGNDRRSYFYTGMSSVGSDEGTVGFILADTRNKRIHLYRMSGATEYAAMESAEGKVQNFKYSATFPILVNINGLATYFMTLKDSAGLVKQFAFVSVKDFSLVGVGESIKIARDNYQMTLASSRIGMLAPGSSEKIEFAGRVARIGSDIKEARNYYYISLSEKPGVVFIATSDLSRFLPVTNPGDQVRIEYLATQDNEINVVGFVNLSLEGTAPQTE